MAGKISFPLTVEIAFGASPLTTALTWTDVSARVQRSRAISASRGFDPESREPLAGRAQMRLTNDDGALTPGNTTSYGLIRNKLPIRIKRASTVLWTGVVEKWSMGFDNGKRPIVDVTCVDRWARLKVRKVTDERMRPLILGQSPALFWPMTDESGSDRLNEIVTDADLVPLYEGTITAGAATNPQIGNATQVATVSASAWPQGWIVGPTVASWSVSAWIWNGSLTADNLFAAGLFTMAAGFFTMTNDGGATGHKLTIEHSATVTKTATSTANNTSGWHHYALTASLAGGTTTYRWYVDGAQRWTDTATGTIEPLYLLSLSATGMGYLATWTRALDAAEIAQQYEAAQLAGWMGDTADVRAARIRAVNGGEWTVITQGTFTSTMSKPTFTDKSVADALLEASNAEGGSIFLDRDGWPVLQSRTYRTGSALGATIPAAVLAHDAQWELDDQALVNVATVERMAMDSLATTVERRNETSIALYDEAPTSLQLWLDSDAQAVDRANAEVNMYARPLPRSRTFTVDVATCQAAISEAAILGIDVGTRIAISGLPATAPPSSLNGFYVESIEDAITHTNWTRTFTVSPALDYWKLEDATFGALDSLYVLAY